MTEDLAAETGKRRPHGIEPFAAPGVSYTEADARRVAQTTIDHGWYSPNDRRMVSVVGDVAWDDPTNDRITRAALHSWEPLDPFLAVHGYDATFDLGDAVAYALQWFELGLEPAAPGVGTAGRRALRLAYIAAATGEAGFAARAGELAEALRLAIIPTDLSLDTTDAIAGLLTISARLSDMPDHLAGDQAAAEAMLLTHLDALFTEDGIHRSQTPQIQIQAIERISMLVTAGYARAEAVVAARRRAEHALAWFIDPSGAPANFGATPTSPITSAYDIVPSGIRHLPDRIVDPSLLYAASAGRRGVGPGRRMRVFEGGGFAVIKTQWPNPSIPHATPAHLVMRTGPPLGGAGCEGGLAVTWHDGGRRLIVEPGPMPVDTGHPAANYAASQIAHNTAFVAGDLPPTAGGLQRWGMIGDRPYVGSQLSAAGFRHRRFVVFEPGSWLLLFDTVEVDDNRPVGIRFHAADDLGLLATGTRFTLLAGADPIVWAVPLAPHHGATRQRGTTEPVPGGWWSPDGHRMVPNWSFGWDADGSATFVTLLAIDERPEPEDPTGQWFGWRTATYRARVAMAESGIADIEIRRTSAEEEA